MTSDVIFTFFLQHYHSHTKVSLIQFLTATTNGGDHLQQSIAQAAAQDRVFTVDPYCGLVRTNQIKKCKKKGVLCTEQQKKTARSPGSRVLTISDKGCTIRNNNIPSQQGNQQAVLA